MCKIEDREMLEGLLDVYGVDMVRKAVDDLYGVKSVEYNKIVDTILKDKNMIVK